MIMIEIEKDLFTLPENHHLVHCISADCKLGAGIAKEFEQRYNLRGPLRELPVYMPGCVYIGKIFNLVTKTRYYHKPTYKNLQMSLRMLNEWVKKENIKFLGMPRIGTGLDKLHWNKVKKLIEEEFKGTNVTITVCHL